MWKAFLKYGAAFTVGFVSALIIVFIFVRWGIYKMITSREGFQTSNTEGSVENEATCEMMKIIIMKAEENVKRTREMKDATLTKLVEDSLESIKKEMQSLKCP